MVTNYINKTVKRVLPLLLLGVVFTACTKDELGPSIFDTKSVALDSASYTYAFDKFLDTAYVKKYNLNFMYKMQDVSADMNYNLVPATLENSMKMAVLTKYLWFDVYAKIVNPDFLKAYGPRLIHLIGSPAYNPINGTMILGLAEGGIKVSLFRVNNMVANDPALLNEFYFKTMHHEFAHILHQTKTYPKEFNLISFKHYDPFAWQDRDERVSNSLGFVSSYGGSQTREDFVEVIANYIVKTDADWNEILDNASNGWIMNQTTGVVTPQNDNDGVDGKAVILQKLAICRNWLKDSWGVNLDELRKEVQYRQQHINVDSLLTQIHK